MCLSVVGILFHSCITIEKPLKLTLEGILLVKIICNSKINVTSSEIRLYYKITCSYKQWTSRFFKIFHNFSNASIHNFRICFCNLPCWMQQVLRVVFSKEPSSSLRILVSTLNSSLFTHWPVPLPVCAEERLIKHYKHFR